MTGERGIEIQEGVSGSILITGDHNIVQGITRLPTDYSTRIQNFILEYTGTPEKPVPFGGREEALRALDDWLAADGFPYLLLAASAGRGKSALLVRWLEGLRERDPDLPLVFVPVSLRFNTASQAVFFAALARILDLLLAREAGLLAGQGYRLTVDPRLQPLSSMTSIFLTSGGRKSSITTAWMTTCATA